MVLVIIFAMHLLRNKFLSLLLVFLSVFHMQELVGFVKISIGRLSK